MDRIYAVFRSRTQALDCAALFRRCGIAAQAVSSPREANAGCGLSVRFSAGELARARGCMARAEYSAFAGFLRERGGGIGKF